MENTHRTYEPLKFLGRLFWTPIPADPATPRVSYAASWQDNGQYWAPTVIARVPFTRWAVGVGVWLDADPDAEMVHEDDAEYDAYAAVNGNVNRDAWQAAREEVAKLGLDPDAEMEYLQAQGLFE
jgi:hypothetical protein